MVGKHSRESSGIEKSLGFSSLRPLAEKKSFVSDCHLQFNRAQPQPGCRNFPGHSCAQDTGREVDVDLKGIAVGIHLQRQSGTKHFCSFSWHFFHRQQMPNSFIPYRDERRKKKIGRNLQYLSDMLTCMSNII